LSPRIQWHEFATLPQGQLISDDIFVLPSHPNSARYRIVVDEDAVNQRDLHVLNVTLADAGTYACVDGVASIVEVRRATAELVILGGSQRCTTTMPDENANLAVIERQSITAECIIDYRGNLIPFMRWNGPPPFAQIQSSTPTASYSAMQAYADRTMHANYWQSVTNFTEPTTPPADDAATNVPDFVNNYNSPRVTVHWTPTITHVTGVKPLNEYYVGDELECGIDAFPSPAAEWTNIRTGESYSGTTLTIQPHWLGLSQQMRCQAMNIINNMPFSDDYFIQVNVVSPPTTPTTTPPTTTTPPPAEADCDIITGHWESIHPLNAHLCIEIDTSPQVGGFGNLHGVLRNSTDVFWVDLMGAFDTQDRSHASWTGIWPQNRYVAGFIGECSKCHGVEHLLVSAISRTKGGPPCATPGEIQYSQEFEFVRSSSITCPPISIPVPTWQDEV
jgi:hypothetical protein